MSKPPARESAGNDARESGALEEEEFLARWSKRKALAREGVDLPEPDDDAARDSSTRSDGSADEGDDVERHVAGEREAAPATVPELPSIESLDEDSDYGAFLAAGVPVDLQRKALRKLFQSPRFNVRDGLDDYDLDFSSPEPLGDIVTAEMRDRVRRELERFAGLDDDSPEEETPAAHAQVADSDEQEQPADSEPDDDQSETA